MTRCMNVDEVKAVSKYVKRSVGSRWRSVVSEFCLPSREKGREIIYIRINNLLTV